MEQKIKKVISEMTLEEKISLLTGNGYTMRTTAVERVGIPAKRFADGPQGIRIPCDEKGNPDLNSNATAFPCLASVGATWDTELVGKLGKALARDCIHEGVHCLLGPGGNIKRHPFGGRNFEYVSEDPVLSGEICAAYINGLQSLGVAASLKHYALNNQETDRLDVSADVDLRTAMEIYLKSFEIAVKKSQPASVMCAYNKIHSIWCSENRWLLEEVLREKWGYTGYVVSDWGAVHNPSRSFANGLDLQMPGNFKIQEDIKKGLEEGLITEGDIDRAVSRFLTYIFGYDFAEVDYDRDEQHAVAREVAAAGCVLLKNDGVLPITKEKYKKIAVIGEYAVSPYMQGQGSAEVYPQPDYVDSPLIELKKALGDDVEIVYKEMYKKAAVHDTMQWIKAGELNEFTQDCDLVIFFVGDLAGVDTENFDRSTAEFSNYQKMFVTNTIGDGKKVVVVNQSGGPMLFNGIVGKTMNDAHAIIQMWLAGEAGGSAIVDILCGKVNPSGKLSETFPKRIRTDLNYPGENYILTYNEKEEVGYRYYDRHPDEIAYPFGHGLSYTTFGYDNLTVTREGDDYIVAVDITNTGAVDGAEAVQTYVTDTVASVKRPEKELRAFTKVFLKAGETKRVTMTVPLYELGYYNVLLREFVTEPGEYVFKVGASSRDIRLQQAVMVNDAVPYSTTAKGECTLG